MGERGERVGRRSAIWAIGCLALLTCSAGVAAALTSTGPSETHRAAAAVATPTTVVAPEETTTPTTVPAIPTTTTTEQRPSATTTTLHCHNSTDPRCGPFRWLGEPGPNAPATDIVEWTPEVPKVGEDVTFTVTWDDPDAPTLLSSMNVCIGDRVAVCVSGTSFIACDRYGAWDLPARQPFHEVWTTHYTFTKAGVFPVGNHFSTTSNHCPAQYDPYGSEASFSGQATVEPAESTTTTTTTTTR